MTACFASHDTNEDGDNDTSVKNGPVRIRDMVVMGWKLIPTTLYMMPLYRGKESRYLC